MDIEEYKSLTSKPKKKRNRDEDKLCMAFTKHCQVYFPRMGGILNWTHIANEGRSPQEGDKLKKMGVCAGWFDYSFIWHEGFARIGFLEAKIGKNDLSPSQKTFAAMMRPMGISCEKFYSVREGHEFLISWGIKPKYVPTIFAEPDYLTKQEKFQLAHDFFKRTTL